MAGIYSISVPSPTNPIPDEKQSHINDIAELVNDNPELTEAVLQLVFGLEHAWNQTQEDRTWVAFTDNIQKLISRAKQDLIEHSPDNGEEHA